MRLLFLVVVPLVLLGCPKHAPNPAQGDEELLARYAARLEEVDSRFRMATGCPDRCQAAQEGCELARNICDVSARLPERADVQKRCAGAQEACARYNEGCSACQGR